MKNFAWDVFGKTGSIEAYLLANVYKNRESLNVNAVSALPPIPKQPVNAISSDKKSTVISN